MYTIRQYQFPEVAERRKLGHEETVLVPSLTLQQANNTAHYTEIKLGIKLTVSH